MRTGEGAGCWCWQWVQVDRCPAHMLSFHVLSKVLMFPWFLLDQWNSTHSMRMRIISYLLDVKFAPPLRTSSAGTTLGTTDKASLWRGAGWKQQTTNPSPLFQIILFG